VRAVSIPKLGGGIRVLGVPTIADRIAQTVVAGELEKVVEPKFHPDSYGYRPRRGALDAVGVCRKRCWASDWAIKVDIQGFFDTVDHALMLKAVEANTDLPWVLLYVRRWLTAPLQQADGSLTERTAGTPQGSAVSPVLANLFLHYAFDAYMARKFPDVRFERYVDDLVVHAVSERQAQMLRRVIDQRFAQVGLRMHPDKTVIAYCRDSRRNRSAERITFDFLGFTFAPRGARDKKGEMFTSFLPAVSGAAMKRMGRELRSWQLHHATTLTLEGLAQRINPIVRGWMNYYGRFYRSKLYPLLMRINTYLVRWAGRKFKRLRGFNRAYNWWWKVVPANQSLFAHWAWSRGFQW
jgi:RNA-directed DNA polymerase